MSGDLDRLQQRVEEVGLLRRLHAKTSGLLGMVLACVGLYLLYSALDIAFKLSRPGRAVSLTAVAACVGYVAYVMLVRPLVKRIQAARIASEIEKSYPEIEEALSTSIEYGTDREKAEHLSSPALVDALVADTHDRTKDMAFTETIDWRVTRRLASGTALAGLVALVCLAGWPHLFGKTLLRLLNPLSDIDPPTFTVIDSLSPRDGTEVAKGDSVQVVLEVRASVPDSADITVRSGEGDSRTEAMIGGDAPGRFLYSLSRIVEDLEFTVAAGDATSRPHRISVYVEPRVLDIGLRIEYPEYTGMEPRDIADGLGEVTALRGSKVTVKARLNKPVVSGRLVLGEKEINGRLTGGDEPALEASFVVEKDDTYSVRLVDERGRHNARPPEYRITALPDRAPKIRIVRPDREVMAFRNQPVELEIEAEDDYGLKEIGVYHTLGGEEKKLAIKKFGGAGERDAVEEHPLHLALKGFKGGEIIQYYAYARDNDTMGGPKEAIGELHFIRTYDEEAYAPGPMQERKKMPEAAKKVEDLIKRQMEVLKKTFELAREENASDAAAAPEGRTADAEDLSRKAKSFGEEQAGIKKDLDGLLAEVEENLPDHMTQGEEVPIELEELRSASKKMGSAVEELGKPSVRSGSSREAEALRHLSEAQRLILSEFADESFRAAMENSARQQRQNRRRREQQEAEELEREMAQLPPMLEREKDAERELERLEDEENAPGTPEEQDERRKLKRKLAEEQKQLAQQARQSSQRMRNMRNRSSQTESAAEAMQQAAQSMEQAARSAEQNETDKAKRSATEASRRLEQAQRDLERSMERHLDERIERAKSDAEELAAEEERIAADAKAAADAERQAKDAGDPEKAEAGAKAAEAAAKDLASKQKSLRGEADSLAKELGELATSARNAAPQVRLPLERAEARAQSGTARSRMEAAQKSLESKEMGPAEQSARDAAGEMKEVAEDLNQALEAARMREAERLAQAIEKAKDIVEKENQIASTAARGQMEEPVAAQQKELRKSTEELAATAPGIRAVREAGKDTEVRRSFAKAGQRMRSAEQEMSAKDAKAVERSALDATREARRGLEALEAASGKDLETEIGKLLEAARDAKESQERVDKVLGNADERAAEGKPVTPEEAKRAAQHEERAAERTSDFAERLGSAARRLSRSRPSDDLPGELGSLRDRVEKAALPERMEELGKLLKRSPEALAKEAEARAAAEEERSLMRNIDAAARRLESLLAEASDEELRRLRTAEAEAREAAKDLSELEKGVKAMEERASKPSEATPGPEGREPTPTPTARGMRDRADGLEDDLAFMERRLKEMRLDEEDLRRARSARELVKEVRRALERNQLPRPGGRLADASGDFQAIGDELMRRIEEALKRRKITEPADETAPEEYRKLVEKYYRALSED